MFAGIRKRLAKKQLERECEADGKDADVPTTFMPSRNYIQISQGKIQLVHTDRATQACRGGTRMVSEAGEQESQRLEHDEEKNQNGTSPTFEKELREQLENMNRLTRVKDRRQQQTCRDHKALQVRFTRQENLLKCMQQENRSLLARIRQYEHCLDDVMRKVVDAIVAEDNLREEVVMLKSRVRDLEAQNAALTVGSAKTRDEGYCTMSSGQPQPSNSHLEYLPEEPEQWLLPNEPCSTEMEDWSMSQDELAVITFDDGQQPKRLQMQTLKCLSEPEWLWNADEFVNSTTVETGSVADNIAQLLQQKLVHSEDEEMACTNFTNDFYKLVNIRSNSSHSLHSVVRVVDGRKAELDYSDDDEDSSSSEQQLPPGEAHTPQKPMNMLSCAAATHELMTSCSSTDTDDMSLDAARSTSSRLSANDICRESPPDEQKCIEQIISKELRKAPPPVLLKSKSVLEENEPICILRHNQRKELESNIIRSSSINCAIATSARTTRQARERREQEQRPASSWRRSHGWKRVVSPATKPLPNMPTILPTPSKAKQPTEAAKRLQQGQRTPPTRIPKCTAIHEQQPAAIVDSAVQQRLQQRKQQAQQHQVQQQQSTRKSKLPPPVPVRRSYVR